MIGIRPFARINFPSNFDGLTAYWAKFRLHWTDVFPLVQATVVCACLEQWYDFLSHYWEESITIREFLITMWTSHNLLCVSYYHKIIRISPCVQKLVYRIGMSHLACSRVGEYYLAFGRQRVQLNAANNQCMVCTARI